jgi:predicted nucleotidyltransferase
MSTNQVISTIKPILLKYGITRSELFGSFARGDYDDKSDVDILIETPDGMSLFDLGYLQEDLKNVLNRDVDIVDYHYINKHLKKYILEKTSKII